MSLYADCHSGDCSPVFDRVYVSMLARGKSCVGWSLAAGFTDPGPYVYTVEAGTTGNPKACDWQPVAAPEENIATVIDPTQRAYGANNNVHYRVRLETPEGIYYSPPAGPEARLSRRDWRIAREIARKERLTARLAWQDGWLLKRRAAGPRCSCTDLQTGDVRDPECEKCYGTGYIMGYYEPISCFPVKLDPEARAANLDPNRGVVSDIRVTGRAIMQPLVEEYDVWVSDGSDDRYIVREIQHVAEIRGVPIVARLGLRPADYSDPVYDLPIPRRND